MSSGMKRAKRVFSEMTELLADQLVEVKKHGGLRNGTSLFGQMIASPPASSLGWAIAGRRAGAGAAIGAIVGGLLIGAIGAAIGGGLGGALGGYSGAAKAQRTWW